MTTVRERLGSLLEAREIDLGVFLKTLVRLKGKGSPANINALAKVGGPEKDYTAAIHRTGAEAVQKGYALTVVVPTAPGWDTRPTDGYEITAKGREFVKTNVDEAVLDEEFKCQECGKKFKKPPANGECPKCRSTDIDLAEGSSVRERMTALEGTFLGLKVGWDDLPPDQKTQDTIDAFHAKLMDKARKKRDQAVTRLKAMTFELPITAADKQNTFEAIRALWNMAKALGDDRLAKALSDAADAANRRD